MKKTLLFFALISAISLISTQSQAQTAFYEAIKNCSKYSQTGTATYQNEIYTIDITLEAKKNSCLYKEKISQGKEWNMLTCTFDNAQLPAISELMKNYNQKYSKEIAKNKIFEAKLSSNEDIFQRYLVNPKYCSIQQSKQ